MMDAKYVSNLVARLNRKFPTPMLREKANRAFAVFYALHADAIMAIE